MVAEYNTTRYHQPSDAFDPGWTFAGTAQEATVAFDLGARIANSAAWPSWKAGTDNAALRATTDGDRKTRS